MLDPLPLFACVCFGLEISVTTGYWLAIQKNLREKNIYLSYAVRFFRSTHYRSQEVSRERPRPFRLSEEDGFCVLCTLKPSGFFSHSCSYSTFNLKGFSVVNLSLLLAPLYLFIFIISRWSMSPSSFLPSFLPRDLWCLGVFCGYLILCYFSSSDFD